MFKKILKNVYDRFDIAIHYWNRRRSFDKLYMNRDPYNVKNSNIEQTKMKEILKVLKDRKFKNTLEIGCGEGYLTVELSKSCRHITGIDISEKAISTARRYFKGNNIDFICENIVNFKPSVLYDLIVAADICYYLAQEHSLKHIEDILSTWVKWLDEKGFVVLLHCFKEPSHPKDWMGRHVMEWYRSLLEKNGLKLLKEKVLKIDNVSSISRYLLSVLKKST